MSAEAAAANSAVAFESVTLNEWQRYFAQTILQPETDAAAHKEMFGRTVASLTLLTAELSKLKKAQLAGIARSSGRDSKHEQLVRYAITRLTERFALGLHERGGLSSEFFFNKEKREETIRRTVEAMTDADLDEHREAVAAYHAARTEAIQERQQAVANPQTEQEFETFIEYHGGLALHELHSQKKLPRKRDEQRAIVYREGIRAMTDEQLARYDEIQAAKAHERRAQQLVERSTIRRISIGDGNYMEILKTYHTKRMCDVWLVVLAEREDRSTWEEMLEAAIKLGGTYAKAWGDRPGGFQFSDEETAERFVRLQDVDLFLMERLTKLVTRRERVRENAIAHFDTLAGRMTEQAEGELTRERRENTERRLMLAENARDRAHDQLAMAGTLTSYAEALRERLTRHTDRIRWRTHAEAFERLLERAGGRMAAVEYPWPVVAKHTLREVAQQIGERDGSILVTRRIIKLCQEAEGEAVRFVGSDADKLRHFYRRARRHRVRGWALDSIREALGDYRRCQLNYLENLPELRAALREHQGIRVERDEMTRAEKVMLDLYPGKFPPDYFPTPPDVVELMLEYADLEDGMSCLEPSAGSGHIVNVVREHYPSTGWLMVELSGLLCKALAAQGYPAGSIINSDFLTEPLAPNFDRIIMNPPFGCDGVGTDIDHVRHAYTMLKPGGRLVSLMSDGVFYRGDNKAQEFRSWLEEEIEEDTPRGFDFELPEGAFLNSDRPTSWAARVVVVNK